MAHPGDRQRLCRNSWWLADDCTSNSRKSVSPFPFNNLRAIALRLGGPLVAPGSQVVAAAPRRPADRPLRGCRRGPRGRRCPRCRHAVNSQSANRASDRPTCQNSQCSNRIPEYRPPPRRVVFRGLLPHNHLHGRHPAVEKRRAQIGVPHRHRVHRRRLAVVACARSPQSTLPALQTPVWRSLLSPEPPITYVP